MVRRFQCPNCGEHGWILSELPTVAALCLRCSHRTQTPNFRSRRTQTNFRGAEADEPRRRPAFCATNPNQLIRAFDS